MTKRRTRNHNLSPQTIDAATWFYEDRKGLLIVHEIHADGGHYIRTDQFVIPWRMVMAAAQRHELTPAPSTPSGKHKPDEQSKSPE